MATRKTPDAEVSANPAPRSARPRVSVVWVHDAPVCVKIIDSPPPRPSNGVCRCPACHSAEFADWAERFLP